MFSGGIKIDQWYEIGFNKNITLYNFDFIF